MHFCIRTCGHVFLLSNILIFTRGTSSDETETTANPEIPGSFDSSRDKKHDTEVRETFNPAVTKEIVIPKETEETTIAVDRELHQGHYQTRVQPIEDREVLEEEHRHNVLPVENRVQRDVDDELVRRRLEEEVRLPIPPPQLKSSTLYSRTTENAIQIHSRGPPCRAHPCRSLNCNWRTCTPSRL